MWTLAFYLHHFLCYNVMHLKKTSHNKKSKPPFTNTIYINTIFFLFYSIVKSMGFTTPFMGAKLQKKVIQTRFLGGNFHFKGKI